LADYDLMVKYTQVHIGGVLYPEVAIVIHSRGGIYSGWPRFDIYLICEKVEIKKAKTEN